MYSWKITKDTIFDLSVMVMKVNANIAENQGMTDMSFRNMLFELSK
jgi:hypothetical protein